jgi:hypothetical protein
MFFNSQKADKNKKMLDQCVKDAVIVWHHLALEAEITDDEKQLNKPAVIEKYNLELETVSEDFSNCPYCLYDYTVSSNASCEHCPGLLSDGSGFSADYNGTPCYAPNSAYLKFEFSTGSELTSAVKEMYELTKRVAEFHNVKVEV